MCGYDLFMRLSYDMAKKIRRCHYYVCVLDYGVVLLITFQDASKKQAEEKVLDMEEAAEKDQV